MENIKYRTYTKTKMLSIIKSEGFLFVETNLGDNYIITKKDIADFIILETQRTGHRVEISFYMPGVDNPVLTTYGWFLNRANPVLREEIIDRLVLLQTTNKKPKNVKVFDLEIFNNMSSQEMGIEDNKIKNFDTIYKKYADAQIKYINI